MAQLEFAIELGSSNTVIYKKGSGIVLVEPSLIAIDVSTKKKTVKAVGFSAKKILGKTNENTVISAPIKEGIIVDEKLAFEMLKIFMKKVTPKSVLNKKVRFLFVIPCGISEKEKAQFKSLGYAVGANKIEFVPNVICALIGCGVSTSSSSGTMSMNLGGGTVNLAAISLNTIISGYSISIGGKKMDEAIRVYVKEAYELEVSLQTSEKIKHEAGSLYIHDTSNLEVSGIDVNTKSPRQDVVMGRNIRPAIEFYFNKIVAAVEDVLNNCSPDIVADIANNGIYVTGGLAKLTGLQNYLKTRLRLPIIVSDIAEEAVILGAGKLLNDKKTLNMILSEN